MENSYETSCAGGAPLRMKMGSAGGVSLCGTTIRGGRLLEGRSFSVTTQIPLTRLTRVSKGITFCRTWKQEGRMTVSATDLRRSNRLPWRRYGNPGGARLWTGCAPGQKQMK